MARPHLDVRCLQGRGAKLEGEAQGSLFHPGVTGEGKAGRVNVSEPPLTPRQSEPRVGGGGIGVQGWPLGSGRRRPEALVRSREHRRPGV